MAFDKEYYDEKRKKLTQKWAEQKDKTLQSVINQVVELLNTQNEINGELKEIEDWEKKQDSKKVEGEVVK